MRVLSIFGTRPEAIKMAPVVSALQQRTDIDSLVCVTAQHREMLDQVISLFDIRIDRDLNLMRPDQSLTGLTSAALQGLEPVLEELKPEWVLVHGDTTTCMAASLAAFYAQTKIGHVEAGLRTHNLLSPWPEEANRSIVGRLATHHFAPTQLAQENLRREGIDDSSILVTGNTVIDALRETLDRLRDSGQLSALVEATVPELDMSKRTILVTGHRRESFDGGLHRVCEALASIAHQHDVQVVYPVHLNPKVQLAVSSVLQSVPGVHLLPPLDYLPFVALMAHSTIVITDSGGIQEEAPAIGKPVLVTRDTTERPEAVSAGGVSLVGTDTTTIVEATTRLLQDADHYRQMATARSPYGDGNAAVRIADYLGSLQQ